MERKTVVIALGGNALGKDAEEQKEAVAKILKENMEQAADLLVPLDVDVHEGASWFEAK